MLKLNLSKLSDENKREDIPTNESSSRSVAEEVEDSNNDEDGDDVDDNVKENDDEGSNKHEEESRPEQQIAATSLSIPQLSLGRLSLGSLPRTKTPNTDTSSRDSNSNRSSRGEEETEDKPLSSLERDDATTHKQTQSELPIKKLAFDKLKMPPVHEEKLDSNTTNIPTIKLPSTRKLQVDLLMQNYLTIETNPDASLASQEKNIYEKLCSKWFGHDDHHGSESKHFQIYVAKPLSAGKEQSCERENNEDTRIVCQMLETDLNAQLFEQTLFENEMLKRKLEQAGYALNTYEMENSRLRREIATAKTPFPIINNSADASTDHITSSDREIEILKEKIRKHEELRNDMVKTVEALKQQHSKLTQAIITQQQQLHKSSNAQNSL